MAKSKLIYICSGARCGSTITDMFLGGHSAIASLGEVNFLGNAIRLDQFCSCGRPFNRCDYWRLIFDRLKHETGIDLLRQPYAYPLWDARARVIVDHDYQDWLFHTRFYVKRAWLGIRDKLPDGLHYKCPIPPSYSSALQNKMRLVSIISEEWDKKIVVDSSKNPWEAQELSIRFPGQVLIVFVVRDGRGVYFSKRTSGFSKSDSIKGWRRYYRNALPKLLKRVPKSCLLIMKYEDLASRPEYWGSEICSRVGITYEPKMMDLNSNVRHMASGNDTRFLAAKGIRLDERWRRDLTNREFEYFEKHAGNLNRELGYA